MKIFCILYLVLFLSNTALGQLDDNKESILSEFTNELYLDTDETIAFSNNNEFKELIKDAKIVAFGEPLHAFHEPLVIRNSLFKYLVREMNFNVIAIETGFSTSKIINDYVLGKIQVDISEICKANLSYGFGNLKEYVELINWIKDYNNKLADNKKIRFYGVDLTGSYFPNAYKSIDIVLEYLSVHDTSTYQTLLPVMSQVLKVFKFDIQLENNSYLKETQEQQNNMTGAIIDMISFLKTERMRLVESSSKEDFEWILQIAINALNDDAFMRLMPDNFDFEKQTGLKHTEAANMREVTMCENLKWVLNKNPSNRVMFFAHNVHIMKDRTKYDENSFPYKAGINLRNPAGMYLKTTFQDKYFVIGCHYKELSGEFETKPLNVTHDDLASILVESKFSNYFLNLKKLQSHDKLNSKFNQNMSTRGGNNGEKLIEINPTKSYDGLIFIQQMSPVILNN